MRIKISLAFFIIISIIMTLTSYVLLKHKNDSDMMMKTMKLELNKLMQRCTTLEQELEKATPQIP